MCPVLCRNAGGPLTQPTDTLGVTKVTQNIVDNPRRGNEGAQITRFEGLLFGQWAGSELRAAVRACNSSTARFHCFAAAQHETGH